MFKKFLAILVGKLTNLIISFSTSGATAAPGLISLKIEPKLLCQLKNQLKFSIIVSGTNGKTTTTRMIASILKADGRPYYHNRAGSNLLRGVTSTLVKAVNLKGELPVKIGLWEIDEAVLPKAIKQLEPRIVVLTNLFRDQLDRYGEIDTLAKKWLRGLKKLPSGSEVILNADDPAVASLGKKLKAKVSYYSIKDPLIGHEPLAHASDATLCPKCLLPLKYTSCFVSHLGTYHCPKCGEIQPRALVSASCVKLGTDGVMAKITCPPSLRSMRCRRDGGSYKVKLPGIYNVYNLLAAFSVAKSLKISGQIIKEGLKNFHPAFGRFETIKFKGKTLRILLVKNPTGFNQVLKTLIQLTKHQKISLLFVLNDLIADGRDVSWIWDVDITLLNQINISKLIVSGTRHLDMALRLKHANIKYQILNIKYLRDAVKTLINQTNSELYILPTYTAMLETRRILAKMKLVHCTWND